MKSLVRAESHPSCLSHSSTHTWSRPKCNTFSLSEELLCFLCSSSRCGGTRSSPGGRRSDGSGRYSSPGAVAPLLGRCRMNGRMSTEPSGPCPLSLAAPLSTDACWDSSLLRKRVAELGGYVTLKESARFSVHTYGTAITICWIMQLALELGHSCDQGKISRLSQGQASGFRLSLPGLSESPNEDPGGEGCRTVPLAGHVGFDSLPDQLVNKSVSQGFCFNILCVGCTVKPKNSILMLMERRIEGDKGLT
ncbi:hypothetical protein ACRRTK_001877 [Alexandromys fortis]